MHPRKPPPIIPEPDLNKTLSSFALPSFSVLFPPSLQLCIKNHEIPPKQNRSLFGQLLPLNCTRTQNLLPIHRNTSETHSNHRPPKNSKQRNYPFLRHENPSSKETP